MKNLLLISSLLFLFSCENEKKIESYFVKERTIEDKFPFLIGNKEGDGIILEQQKRKRGNYKVLYIGELSDTIVLWNIRNDLRLPPHVLDESGIFTGSIKEKTYRLYIDSLEVKSNYVKSGVYFRRDVYNLLIGDSLLNLKIDTSQIITKEDFNTSDDSTFLFKAYPVYITNNSSDSVALGFNKKLSITLEAKDETGNWITIEILPLLGCGNEIEYIVVPPNETLITSVIIYTGDFKTQLRLKLGNSYSDPFNGGINKSQLIN